MTPSIIEDNMPINLEDSWAVLTEGMTRVFKREHMTPQYYMNVYKSVYDYCTSATAVTAAKKTAEAEKAALNPMTAQQFVGQELYTSLKSFLSEHADGFTVKAVELSGEPLLEYYTREWENFRFAAKVLDGIYGYLNRHWIRREQDEGRLTIYVVYSMALQIFKQTTFDKLEVKIRAALLEEIRRSRQGHIINDRYISSTIQSLIEIGLDKIETKDKTTVLAPMLHIYKGSFEAQFLEQTREFYTNEVREFLNGGAGGGEPSCKEYMKKVEQRIMEEERRVALLLNNSTMEGLQAVLNEVMITNQLEFIQSHFGPLLVEMANDDISRMYLLCSRVASGLDALRTALQAFVTKEGHVAIEQRAKEAFNDPKMYVNTILDVHERYQGLVDRALAKEPGFMKSLDSAAIAFINKNAVVKMAPPAQHCLKSAELIARYCDGLARKNAKMPDENEMDELQRKVITIFKYLEDKDIFLKFYTKHFCKRLINELSASDEAESSFIARLTECCGFEFTSRLTKMVQDCTVSKDLTRDFKEAQDAKSDAKRMEFSVQILSTGTWPSFGTTTLALPKVLSSTIEALTSFYNGKYTGRRLQWVYTQSRGELTSTAFKGKKYVFGVTTAQMCTLLLFNEQSSYVAEKIMDGTGMDAKTTSIVIGSLIKNQVLSSDVPIGDNQECPLNAKITLNLAYTNKKVRVDLSKMAVAVQQAKDSEHVAKGVDEDRKNMISACIVRIMKARKTLSHHHLLTEVITQINSRFKPKVEMIKRCIGNLIEKEYMKRSESQRDHYDYMA